MDCSRFEELLSDYIEGTLTNDVAVEMTAHMNSCPGCRILCEDLNVILSSSTQLMEEVPFFLRNRLYFIPEAYSEESEPVFYMKWVAAMIATIILFFNLFYFTNIYPQANRTLHGLVSGIERIAVETEALFSRFKKDQELNASPITFISNGLGQAEQGVKEQSSNG